MTFQQLQHLLAVHRTGSFSLAAKEMFVSQSAVSNAISGLEQELGCRIFVRSAHGLSLTPEGTRIVDLANGICERQTLLAQTGNSQQNQVFHFIHNLLVNRTTVRIIQRYHEIPPFPVRV